jgi:hypothetical protein
MFLKFYKKSASFQAFLCPTLPSDRPPESVSEPPCTFNLVPANLRKDAAAWIRRSTGPTRGTVCFISGLARRQPLRDVPLPAAKGNAPTVPC